jgi:hypothetical protein
MNDPSKYIRKLYVDNMPNGVPVYDGIAPNSASGIYAVITDVNVRYEDSKTGNLYTATVSIVFYDEKVTNYGHAALDDKCDLLLQALVKTGTEANPTMSGGFTHHGCRLLSMSSLTDQFDGSLAYQKVLRLQHKISN